MTVKKDILDALWFKIDFWGRKTTQAQEQLILAKAAHREALECLDAAENTVEYYKSTHGKLLTAVNTIEDFLDD